MSILYVAIDIAKNVFAAHGVNEAGQLERVRPAVARAKLHTLIARMPPCAIGMEACSGAHYWARLFIALGHTVRLMAPKFVVPYRLSGQRGKNDAADAVAICEALQRETMHCHFSDGLAVNHRLDGHGPRCEPLSGTPFLC